VLEGIGLIEKGGKNYIKWTGADATSAKDKSANRQLNSQSPSLENEFPSNFDPQLKAQYLAAKLENKKIEEMEKQLD
jgi:hypothetical protein